MAVPDYQEFMLPLLKVMGDNHRLATSDYYDAVSDLTGLSADDREELVPSGAKPAYKNRISWAAFSLVKAGLLERPSRGVLQITPEGKTFLATQPTSLNIDDLRRFDAFREYEQALNKASDKGKPDQPSPSQSIDMPPDEQMRASYRQLRQSLADDLLTLIKAAPPLFFERVVVDLLVRMGYGGSHEDAGQAIGKSGDEGIDGIIKEDPLGLDFVYIQAKRWESVVGRPQIQGFAGSLEGQRARKGVFITTSSFTNNAREYVKNIEKRIVPIDGTELASLMLDYGLGVTEETTYKVQRIDPAYFGEE